MYRILIILVSCLFLVVTSYVIIFTEGGGFLLVIQMERAIRLKTLERVTKSGQADFESLMKQATRAIDAWVARRLQNSLISRRYSAVEIDS